MLFRSITFEVDKEGNGTWTELKKVEVAASSSAFVPFKKADAGVWVRATSNIDTRADLTFILAQAETRTTQADAIFDGLATVKGKADSKGLMWALGNNRRALGILATTADGKQYYELDKEMNLIAKEDTETAEYIEDKFAVPSEIGRAHV